MLTLLSPAKKLDLEPVSSEIPWSTPALWRESERMMTKAKNMSRKTLRELMHISPALAELNWTRHNSFETPFTPQNAKQAALCFNGDVYFGLDAKMFSPEQLQWSQENLAILSGLFGILRPLDLVQAYRLEMGTPVPSRRGKNLYHFWGESVTKRINEITAEHEDRTVVNLASSEYSKVVLPKNLAGPMVTIAFKEIKPGKEPQMIGTIAKRSRGKMARWIVEEKALTQEHLRDFDVDDYRFDKDLSTDAVFTFTRQHVEGRMIEEFQQRKVRENRATLR